MNFPGVRNPKPTGRFDLVMWFFMRLSGVLLLVLVLGHLGIMHLMTDIHNIDFLFIADRYKTPLWRIYDLFILMLALLHGLNGVRTVIDDYVHQKGWRVLALSLLFTITFAFAVVGSVTILTFKVPEMIG